MRHTGYFKTFYCLLAIAVVFVLYQASGVVNCNRTFCLTLVQFASGEQASTQVDRVHLPGVRPGVAPTFTADVPRRDAVVEAFKVCVYPPRSMMYIPILHLHL